MTINKIAEEVQNMLFDQAFSIGITIGSYWNRDKLIVYLKKNSQELGKLEFSFPSFFTEEDDPKLMINAVAMGVSSFLSVFYRRINEND